MVSSVQITPDFKYDPNVEFFDQLQVPARILDPKKQNGLGVTNVTAQGTAGDGRVRLDYGTLEAMRREGLSGTFDFAFIDANKEDYDSYYEGAMIIVKKGGLIVLDNMFREGRVADPTITDTSVTSIAALNAKIARDERGDRALIPVGDGMMMVRKR